MQHDSVLKKTIINNTATDGDDMIEKLPAEVTNV